MCMHAFIAIHVIAMPSMKVHCLLPPPLPTPPLSSPPLLLNQVSDRFIPKHYPFLPILPASQWADLIVETVSDTSLRKFPQLACSMDWSQGRSLLAV